MIQIKNRYTCKTIHTVNADTLIGADLSNLDLTGADLTRADLTRANLSGEQGIQLEQKCGTATAANLLLWRPATVLPSFDSSATRAETLARLEEMKNQPL